MCIQTGVVVVVGVILTHNHIAVGDWLIRTPRWDGYRFKQRSVHKHLGNAIEVINTDLNIVLSVHRQLIDTQTRNIATRTELKHQPVLHERRCRKWTVDTKTDPEFLILDIAQTDGVVQIY
ncbi:hypothetical protein D3C71_1743230 [compost metagenome]